MKEYIKLTEEQKEKVREFVINYIDSVYEERVAYGTRIEGLDIEDAPEIKEEFIESEFVGYYCSECGDYIEDSSEDGLILHILEHLEEDKDEDI